MVVCSAGEILFGIFIVFKKSRQTWRWHKNRNANDSDPMPQQAYKDILRGDGQGRLKVGKHLELSETMRSILLASMIKQEYIDACESNPEDPDEDLAKTVYKRAITIDPKTAQESVRDAEPLVANDYDSKLEDVAHNQTNKIQPSIQT